jgi:DNA-binding FadR family transcriptional regulator
MAGKLAPIGSSADALADTFRKAVKSSPATNGEPGLTAEDLVKALGCSRNTVRVLLRRWHVEGRLIHGFQMRQGYGVDGRSARIPVYRIK